MLTGCQAMGSNNFISKAILRSLSVAADSLQEFEV
jgi:hypothetical protein